MRAGGEFGSLGWEAVEPSKTWARCMQLVMAYRKTMRRL